MKRSKSLYIYIYVFTPVAALKIFTVTVFTMEFELKQIFLFENILLVIFLPIWLTQCMLHPTFQLDVFYMVYIYICECAVTLYLENFIRCALNVELLIIWLELSNVSIHFFCSLCSEQK